MTWKAMSLFDFDFLTLGKYFASEDPNDEGEK